MFDLSFNLPFNLTFKRQGIQLTPPWPSAGRMTRWGYLYRTVAAVAVLLQLLGTASLPGASPQDDNRGETSRSYGDSADGILCETTVGMEGRLEQLVIPGGLLEVRPLVDRHEPLLLRIENAAPHGTDHRYDLAFSALEPGVYRLADYLQRSDGSKLEMPPWAIRVETTIPPGFVPLNPLTPAAIPSLGGYRIAIILGSMLWFLGLAFLLYSMRPPELPPPLTAAPQMTLAQRLGPLIAKARDGTLHSHEKAQLEQMLIGHWVERLDLRRLPPGELFAQLQAHPEAGPLLVQLERWFHRPGEAGDADLHSLLAPYAQTAAPLPQSSDGIQGQR